MTIKYYILFLFLLAITQSVVAETYRANANYFIRSTPQFSRSARNTVGLLSRGSTFRVLERVRRRDNAYAARIQLITPARGGGINMRSREQWVYMSGRSNFTRLTTDPRPTEARAPRDAADPNCPGCTTNSTAPRNANDIVDLAQQIVNDDNTQASSDETRTAALTPTPASPTPAPDIATTRFGGPRSTDISNYSNSTEVSNMITWARHNVRRRSIGLCYRLVKEAIANKCGPPRREYTCRNPFSRGGRNGAGNNLAPAWYGDNAAANARNTLKNYGFINLLDSEPYKSQIGTNPDRAPKGAVLVYSGGRSCGRTPCGHIEIKTDEPGRPGYISDYALDRPITRTRNGGRYRLIGVMIKPGVQ